MDENDRNQLAEAGAELAVQVLGDAGPEAMEGIGSAAEGLFEFCGELLASLF